MKFVLTPYPNSVSEQELLEDLKLVADKIDHQYLSIAKYKQNGGKHSDSTFCKYFGSWTNALSKAGLRISKNEVEKKRISNESLIEDIKRVANLYKAETITYEQYNQMGEFSGFTIRNRLGTWENALIKAGLKPTGFITNISDIELLNEIERIWIQLGKQPTSNDIKKGLSKYNLCTFTRRFGGWRGALETFVKYVNGEVIYEEPKQCTTNTAKRVHIKKQHKISTIHRTNREPNNRLKVQVLMRDGNKCRICGVECNDGLHNIHFDHIIPWSKGGETVLENLQVLCSDCNLAKGNI